MDSAIKIVVIDDHAIVREGLVMLLKSQADMNIVGECGDAKTGLELIQTTDPTSCSPISTCRAVVRLR